ncbi:Alpha-D-GlcNAc alpha-1,2-L-rhamnosyltransferase [hydrothermal vent metagenome]|uniref:Alpha-D-GlcNAc alpha-1,2-L-rhamnosyltransferase n=1 Tax=hydrothermal vent metagenome TaxID=652676 RepID=A0A3B0YBH0_9ZZZZ
MQQSISILGIRGIPAQHGGFETFAEYLAPYMVKHGWKVTVYCQIDGTGNIYEDEWQGIRRVNIPVSKKGAKGTIIFDWKSTLHAAKTRDTILTLGYNTALFCILYRLKGLKNIINMDGIEWKRDKWTFLERTWLYINERAGCLLGNHLIADHPEIKKHLASRVNEKKITMIPYGSDKIESADANQLKQFKLKENEYAIIIARPEPENSILEIVTAFSNKKRKQKLVVLGNFDKADPQYTKKIKNAASEDVVFPGAIYDKSVIQALRYYTCLYIHGHTVGGTNPSLVEALGAGNAVLAHDNKFNRWVAGEKNIYFTSIENCESQLDKILNNAELIKSMQDFSKDKHKEMFTWELILDKYRNEIC